MNVATQLLNERIGNIDRILFGLDPDESRVNILHDRVQELTVKVEQAEMQIPTLRSCKDLIRRLGPLLIQRRSTVAEMSDKAQQILAAKEDLLRSLRYLSEINDLTGVVNKPFTQDVPVLLERVESLDVLLQSLSIRIENQTKDLDMFLNLYENTLRLYSEKLVEWDAHLYNLETK